MHIYDSQEQELASALDFLKEGLKLNERCVLIANYPVRKERKVKGQSDPSAYFKTLDSLGIEVIAPALWFLGGRIAKKRVSDHIMRSWVKLSNKNALREKSRLRAFVDMRPLFMYRLLDDLVEVEARIATSELDIKLICAYLSSDLSLLSDLALLSPESYDAIRNDHGRVYQHH
jgi:hypothetical protein